MVRDIVWIESVQVSERVFKPNLMDKYNHSSSCICDRKIRILPGSFSQNCHGNINPSLVKRLSDQTSIP